MFRSQINDQKGQALIVLLAFMAIAVTLTLAAAVVVVINSQATSAFHQGQEALFYAESGLEHGIRSLHLDPGYMGGVLDIGEGDATISVSGSQTLTITSQGRYRDHSRTVEATAIYEDYSLSVINWSEVP